LRSQVAHDGLEKSAAWEWRRIAREMEETPAERRRFAVFSLGPIPLAVQLGYALGDRTRVELFQYDRDGGSWSWDDAAESAAGVTWSAAVVDEGPWNEAAVRVSLSAEVRPEAGLRAGFEIDIRVAEPSVRWLRPAGATAGTVAGVRGGADGDPGAGMPAGPPVLRGAGAGGGAVRAGLQSADESGAVGLRVPAGGVAELRAGPGFEWGVRRAYIQSATMVTG
jgi:hypothetical protein